LDPSLLYRVDCGEGETICRCDDGDTLINGGLRCRPGYHVQRSQPVSSLDPDARYYQWEAWCTDEEDNYDTPWSMTLTCIRNQNQ
jgi:hypothetical protein